MHFQCSAGASANGGSSEEQLTVNTNKFLYPVVMNVFGLPSERQHRCSSCESPLCPAISEFVRPLSLRMQRMMGLTGRAAALRLCDERPERVVLI